MLQPGIFREYDIRGIAGTDMDDDGVRDIDELRARVRETEPDGG